ncbi:MAG: 50S ribosomal protein L11 methyltransferase [Gammaproteobacteria bacterium]|nr:50S ribosomal protein L11 methyltransferase [Gammaproteobacteria bacterium]
MAWLCISMDCAQADVDRLTEFLDRLGAGSVSISAGDDRQLFGDDPAAPEYWQCCRVRALFPADADVDVLLACLRNHLGPGPAASVSVAAVPDQDWSGSGQSGLEPLLFGERLCICPSWIAPPPARLVLTLDPGLAFGSGTHPTTALCLEWIASRDLRGCTFVDYGCGSGVLGLSAALLGADRVWMADSDPQALAASRANAERNGLLDRLHYLEPRAPLPVPADVLVANILLGPLRELAPYFASVTRPGAEIALSGLLATQAEEGLAAYEPWFSMGPMVFRNEWVLVQGVRRL